MIDCAGGTRVFVLDRGSGHHALSALVPGAVRLRLGAEGPGAAAINPWDVPDVADVAEPKIRFLVRLHALLIGQHGCGADPLGLHPREREVLTTAARIVYARAARGEGRPREGLLRTVLREGARCERVEADGRRLRATTCEALAARLNDLCSGGRFGHLFDEPTRVCVDGAPLVVVDTSLVVDEVAAAVVLAVVEHLSALAASLPPGRISLLTDVVDEPAARGGADLPPVFERESLLNALHESYVRRRVRAGEPSAIAYLHAISDVALFLHPPAALSDTT